LPPLRDHREQLAELFLPDGDPDATCASSCSSTAASGATATGATSWSRSPRPRRRGVAAWNIEFRRLDAGGGWARRRGGRRGRRSTRSPLDAPLDLDDVTVVGHSAGGHLALWAAGRIAAAVQLRAAVGIAAVSDIEEAFRQDSATASSRASPRAPSSRTSRRSSACRPGIPTLLQHGTLDDEARRR
jgi:hypothetical protein